MNKQTKLKKLPETYKTSTLVFKRDFTKKNPHIACNILGATIIRTPLLNIDIQEQEFIVCDNRKDIFIKISCSNKRWITQLKRNPLFDVDRILIAPDLRILELSGHLRKKCLSIRKKIKGESSEQEKRT